jgi:cell fate regulator YaaT (PSP1 superfamily)
MPTIVGVTLRNAPSPVYIDPADVEVVADDVLVIESDRGTELGRVVEVVDGTHAHQVDLSSHVVRVATPEDMKVAAELHTRERAAKPIYRRLVAKHKL